MRRQERDIGWPPLGTISGTVPTSPVGQCHQSAAGPTVHPRTLLRLLVPWGWFVSGTLSQGEEAQTPQPRQDRTREPQHHIEHLQPHKPPPGALSEEGSRDISSAFLTHAPRCNQERPKPSPWHQGSIPAKCRSYRKGKIPAEAVTGLKRPKRQTGGNLCHAAPSLEPCCLYLPHHKTQPLIFPWNNGGLLALWQQAQKGSRVCCGQATSWGLKQQCWAILGHRSCCYTRTSQQSTRDGHTVGEHSPLPARP